MYKIVPYFKIYWPLGDESSNPLVAPLVNASSNNLLATLQA